MEGTEITDMAMVMLDMVDMVDMEDTVAMDTQDMDTKAMVMLDTVMVIQEIGMAILEMETFTHQDIDTAHQLERT